MASVGSASTMINLLTTGYTARVSTAFRSLSSVFGAPLLPVIYTGSIKGAANDMVLDAWQILYAPSADQDDRVLLEVVTFTRNIGGNFSIIAQTHAGDLAKGRIGLLRRHRTHLRADAALLW